MTKCMECEKFFNIIKSTDHVHQIKTNNKNTVFGYLCLKCSNESRSFLDTLTLNCYENKNENQNVL